MCIRDRSRSRRWRCASRSQTPLDRRAHQSGLAVLLRWLCITSLPIRIGQLSIQAVSRYCKTCWPCTGPRIQRDTWPSFLPIRYRLFQLPRIRQTKIQNNMHSTKVFLFPFSGSFSPHNRLSLVRRRFRGLGVTFWWHSPIHLVLYFLRLTTNPNGINNGEVWNLKN